MLWWNKGIRWLREASPAVGVIFTVLAIGIAIGLAINAGTGDSVLTTTPAAPSPSATSTASASTSTTATAIAATTETSIVTPFSNSAGLTALDIKESQQALPPLQREAAAAQYEGMVVIWEMQLSQANQRDENLIALSFEPPGEIFPDILLTVRLADYPWLLSAEIDTPMTVGGVIDTVSASGFQINLADAFLQLP